MFHTRKDYILIKKPRKSIVPKVVLPAKYLTGNEPVTHRGACGGHAFESPFGHGKHVSGHGTDPSSRQGPFAKHLA